MAGNSEVKAVFFDMDDTLVLTSKCDELAFVEVGKLATELIPGVDVAALISGFRKGMKETPWDKEHKVHVDEWRAGLWHASLVAQGARLGDPEALMPPARKLQAEYRDVRLSHFRFLDGAEDMVRRMNESGLKTVIITNGHHEVQRQKVEACGAVGLFGAPNVLVGGEEVLAGRHEKPHPSIFAKACAAAGCVEGEAVHVGDRLKTDVQGGVNAKLAATFWVNAEGKELPEGAPAPTHVVRVVTEVEEIVRGMMAQ